MEKRGGFTLIELLVVVALMAVLATVGFLSYGGYRNENHLKDEGSKIEAVLNNARANSVSQLNGAQWGVHFVNGTSSDVYQQFSGASFASGTPASASYGLGYNLGFGDPATSSLDIAFAPITGALSTDAAVTIVPSPANGMAENIIVNTLGQVTTRFETGLVGYWPLDEGAGLTAYDASGYGDNGTLTNGPTWQTGASCKVGDCLKFFSAASPVNVLAPGVSPHTTMTLAAWVYPTAYPSERSTIILGLGAYYLSLYTDGSAQCYWYGTSPSGYFSSGAGTVPLNTWSFVVATWDGSYAKLYVNGQLKSTNATTGSGNISTATNIGAENTSRQFNGSIDDVRIYNRALSATEIQDLYNAY